MHSCTRRIARNQIQTAVNSLINQLHWLYSTYYFVQATSISANKVNAPQCRCEWLQFKCLSYFINAPIDSLRILLMCTMHDATNDDVEVPSQMASEQRIYIGLFARSLRIRQRFESIEKVTNCLHNATLQAVQMFIVCTEWTFKHKCHIECLSFDFIDAFGVIWLTLALRGTCAQNSQRWWRRQSYWNCHFEFSHRSTCRVKTFPTTTKRQMADRMNCKENNNMWERASGAERTPNCIDKKYCTLHNQLSRTQETHGRQRTEST